MLEGRGNESKITAFCPDRNTLRWLEDNNALQIWSALTCEEIADAEANQKMETKQP